MTDSQPGGYAGDISASAAFADLQRSPDATLIDVRTIAEWAYVGAPVLSTIGKSPVMLEWDRFPDGGLVPDFVGRLGAELDRLGIGRNAPLYFICRSGSRSRNAAILATAAGYGRSYNVKFGFEGRLGPDHRRATEGSWKAEGLPWAQS